MPGDATTMNVTQAWRWDTGVDTDALTQRMLDEAFLLAPGRLFHAARRATEGDFQVQMWMT